MRKKLDELLDEVSGLVKMVITLKGVNKQLILTLKLQI